LLSDLRIAGYQTAAQMAGIVEPFKATQEKQASAEEVPAPHP
jgi:hypothetical protein